MFMRTNFHRQLSGGTRSTAFAHSRRPLSTLPGYTYIYTAPDPKSLTSNSHLLTLLPSEPANPDLAIGTTSALPPTPDSLAENPKFLSLLQETVKAHAHNDPDVQAQAQVYASNAGASLGSGGAFFGQPPASRRRRSGPSGGGGGTGGDGGGGASAQGGAGSGARGGWIHVSDSRSPPDFGRIAWPEDIFGSIEVDAQGNIVGNYQSSGTYRIITREGILGLSPFLRAKLVERLKAEEKKASS